MEGKEADSLRKTSTKMLDEIKTIREFKLAKHVIDRDYRSPFEVTVISQMQTAQQS